MSTTAYNPRPRWLNVGLKQTKIILLYCTSTFYFEGNE